MQTVSKREAQLAVASNIEAQLCVAMENSNRWQSLVACQKKLKVVVQLEDCAIAPWSNPK